MTADSWALGRYAEIAARLRPAAHALVDAVGAGPGVRLLDLAAGQGNCALEAARRGAAVTAVDSSPAMVAAGRTATPADADVAWVEADARAVHAPDADFDAGVSSFGVIFVPEPEAAVAELARVLRPGARLALAVWTPAGALSATFPVFEAHLGPAPHDVRQWGRPERLHPLLDGAFEAVRVEERELPWPAGSPVEAVDWMAANSPQHVAAFAAMGAAAERARAEMAAIIERELGGADPRDLALPWHLVTAVRR